jgi:polyisoprenoid-binding protein YceI
MSQVTYEIDPSHSSVHISVRHMMVANVREEFTKLSGTVKFDRENP